LRGKTLIINLPGSKNGVKESLEALFPFVLHAFKILRGGGHPVQPATPNVIPPKSPDTHSPDIERHRYRSPDTPDYRL
jgi:hypothetical protein